MKHVGKKVLYKGLTMNLCEAYWAAFFDKLGWQWEFQPMNLPWYVPDFLLNFDGVLQLVEVKGGAGSIAMLRAECQKIFEAKYPALRTMVGLAPDILIGHPLTYPDGYGKLWLEAKEIGYKAFWPKPPSVPVTRRVGANAIGQEFRSLQQARPPALFNPPQTFQPRF